MLSRFFGQRNFFRSSLLFYQQNMGESLRYFLFFKIVMKEGGAAPESIFENDRSRKKICRLRIPGLRWKYIDRSEGQ